MGWNFREAYSCLDLTRMSLCTCSCDPQHHCFVQHEGEEDQKVQHCQKMGQALTVAREPPKAPESQPNLRSNTQRLGSSTKSCIASGSLTIHSSTPAACAAFLAPLPVQPWSAQGTFTAWPVASLHRFACPFDLRAFLLNGWRNRQTRSGVRACPPPKGTLEPLRRLYLRHSLRASHSRNWTAACCPSKITALGWPVRPWPARTMARMSLTIASNQPDSLQRLNSWYTACQNGKPSEQVPQRQADSGEPSERTEHLAPALLALHCILRYQGGVRRHEVPLLLA